MAGTIKGFAPLFFIFADQDGNNLIDIGYAPASRQYGNSRAWLYTNRNFRFIQFNDKLLFYICHTFLRKLLPYLYHLG